MSDSATGKLRRAPHPALRGLVGTYHGYHYTGLEPGVHHGLPGASLTLVISFDEPLDVAWLGAPESRGRHWALASGMHTTPALVHHAGTQHGVQLDLSPEGCRRLLAAPAAALAAELVDVEQVIGPLAEEVYDAVAGAGTWPERFVVLDAVLIRLARRAPAAGIRPELSWAWRRLLASHGTLGVRELAEETGWSRRHLTSLFRREYGLPPKQVARVVRLEHSRNMMLAEPTRGLAEVAAESGFADQAHLTREWQDLAGYTPVQWRRHEFPFLQEPEPAA